MQANALASKEHDQREVAGRLTGQHGWGVGGRLLGKRLQRLPHLLVLPGGQRQSIRKMRAAHAGRIGDLRQGRRRQLVSVLPGLGRQGRGRLGGEDQQHLVGRRHRLVVGRGRAVRPLGLLDDHMGVGAPKPERTDAGPPRTIARRPGGQAGRHLQRQAPVNVRTGPLEVQVRRNLAPAHRQAGLDQAGHPGRSFQVPDVGLHRADQQRPLGRPLRREHGSQRPHLDRVSQGRAGAVRFDVIDLLRLQLRVGQRRADDVLLGHAVGRRQAVAPPVLVDRRAPQQTDDPVPRRLGVRQPLQQQYPAPFPTHKTVRRRRKGLATPRRRQHPRLAQVDAQLGRKSDSLRRPVPCRSRWRADFARPGVPPLTKKNRRCRWPCTVLAS